jgi:small subunit ribosomal protein S14
MAKKSAVEIDRKRRRMVKQHKEKRTQLKAVIMDRSKSAEERFKAQIKLAELPRNSSKVRVRNRCGVTGRPRGFYRKLKMSRISLRDLALAGQIPGMVKSSW